MSRQWIATRPGGLEVFELVETEVPAPGTGEVRVRVRAAGMNPADIKHVVQGDPAAFPRPVGYEVAGVLTALGPDTEIASGGGAVGDAVLAYRVRLLPPPSPPESLTAQATGTIVDYASK